MTLSKTQATNLEQQAPKMLDFLEWLSQRRSSEFMSLFAGTGQAAEKEAMMYQTIRASVSNYRSTGELSSKVDLSADHSLAQNSKAFNWLVQNKYFVVSGNRCALTQFALGFLLNHFKDKLQAMPIAIESV